MPGSGGRGRPAASQVWRAELHGAAPLALLAAKPRGLRSPSGTRTGRTRVNGICVAKDHYRPCAPRSPKVRAMAWRRLRLVGLLKQVRSWHETDMPPWSRLVRYRRQSGKHLLPASISAFVPRTDIFDLRLLSSV